MTTDLTKTLADLRETREYHRHRASHYLREPAFGDSARDIQRRLVDKHNRHADAVDAAIKRIAALESFWSAGHPQEHVCTSCKNRVDIRDARWRFVGGRLCGWEHKCGDPQAGYFESIRLEEKTRK